jgi:hypothetical protein
LLMLHVLTAPSVNSSVKLMNRIAIDDIVRTSLHFSDSSHVLNQKLKHFF